ncbi:MAG: ribosomal small subunit methyltransferase [Pseudomonadota bacterium]
MAERQTTAREAAADLVTGVIEEKRPLSDQLSAGALSRLSGPDRARAQRLALVTLRNLLRADAILKRHLRKGPPPFVMSVLRVATVELLETGQEAHGVVGTAVDLVRAPGRRTDGFAGLVNAVLRKVAATPAGDWQALPPQPLPGWLRGRLMSAYGKAATLAIETAQAQGAPVDLTPRDPATAADLAARTGGELLPGGSIRLGDRVQVSDLPGFAEGVFWVQDAAAALCAGALAPQRGARILDLCAAPGGKTLQLAAAGAEVTALDISAQRMVRLQENLDRCGLAARTVVADALDWQPDGLFDAVLLDAPCSATGTIRRHPDLPFVRDASGIKPLVALQAALFDRALGFVRPGGRLVYATCSLLPDEGEHQARQALQRHPGLMPIPLAEVFPGIDPGWIGPDGALRTRPDFLPDRGGIDGFYIAAFRAPG